MITLENSGPVLFIETTAVYEQHLMKSTEKHYEYGHTLCKCMYVKWICALAMSNNKSYKSDSAELTYTLDVLYLAIASYHANSNVS